jgi:hypothetical protein
MKGWCMMATNHLTVAERDMILSGLSDQQQAFIREKLKRGKRTVFARYLVRQKGAAIPEDATFEEIESLLSEWVLTDFVDGGEVSSELQCTCGRNLRYRYTVQHKNTGDTIHFGIDHLEQHLEIDAKTVAAVKKGFEAIDLELDQILLQVTNQWTVEKNIGIIPPEVQIPWDIKEHIDLGLPLLGRQLVRLREIISNYHMGSWNNPVIAKSDYKKNTKKTLVDYDLFGNDTVPIDQSGIFITLMKLPLGLQESAENLIKSGVHSARIICEHLIDKHFAPNRRFLTEKPHLFVPLCVWLDEQVINGHVRLLYKDHEERKYEWITD